VVVIACIEHIYPKDSYGVLLEPIVIVMHFYVQYEVVWLCVGADLKSNSKPAMPFDGFGVIDGGYCICENEEVRILFLP